MSAPLEFAARLLARRGALVETNAGAVEAVLSRELGAELGLGEHAVLAESPSPQAHHVGYGSALLERMVAVAAGKVPFVTARAAVAPARESQARSAAEALVFRNGVFSVGDPSVAVGHRLLAHAAYVLHGDERREGLCAAAASLYTLGVVAGFDDAVAGALEEAPAHIPDAELVLRGAQASLSACVGRASDAALGFRESVQRRFERDRERLEGYFADLLSELDRRAARGRGGVADVQEKRKVIERERAAKIEALSARYVMKVEVRPVALLLVEAPTYRMSLELRRRKLSRTVDVEFDCATRKLVAPVCDGCGSPAPRPAACDDAVHLLCERCAPKSEGRIACSACRGKRG
jgi:hypothetical protein